MNTYKKGVYTLKQDHYILSINYTYYYNTSTNEHPPEEDMEIESADLNGMDITNFFFDFVEDEVVEQVMEHARINK